MKNTGKAYNLTLIHRPMQSVYLVYYVRIKTFQIHDTLSELTKTCFGYFRRVHFIFQTCSIVLHLCNLRLFNPTK